MKATIAAKEEAAGTPLPITEKKRTESMVAQKTAAGVTKVQELGGLAGRLLLAVLAVAIVSRRSLVRIFQIPGMLIIPFVFVYAAVNDLTLLYYGIFIDGMLTVGQFSFWGNYLPRVYPIHLRGTGEGFAANIGGRLVGTSFAWLTSVLAVQLWVPGGDPATKLAYTAAAVAFAVYLAAFVLSFFFPEPGEGHLPE